MKRMRILAMVVVVLLLVAAAGWLVLRPRGAEANALEASGTVEATEADLGFAGAGRLLEVRVREGDAVEAGELLAVLDTADLAARRLAAEAQIAAASAQLAELRAGARSQEVAQAEAMVDAARERMEELARTRERMRALYAGGAVSRSEREEAETAYEVAVAQHEQAREQAALVRAGPRAERLAGQAAAVRQATAQLGQVRAAMENAVIRAPFAGVVTVRHREPGETVSPGVPVLSIMDPADRWVRIYVREDAIGRVSRGQAALIYSDSHPGRAFRGQVGFIAGEAEFTPRNVQTAEERVKLVYAVKVRITGDAGHRLNPGVPADVRLEGGGG